MASFIYGAVALTYGVLAAMLSGKKNMRHYDATTYWIGVGILLSLAFVFGTLAVLNNPR